MPKPQNILPAQEVTLSLNSQTIWYLERLVEKGLYGNSRAQAAIVVIYDHCKLLIAQGELDRAPLIPPSKGKLSSLQSPKA